MEKIVGVKIDILSNEDNNFKIRIMGADGMEPFDPPVIYNNIEAAKKAAAEFLDILGAILKVDMEVEEFVLPEENELH